MKLVNDLTLMFDDFEQWKKTIKTIEFNNTLYQLLIQCNKSFKNSDDLGVFLNIPRLERYAINRYCENKTDDNREFEEKTRQVVAIAFNKDYDKAYGLFNKLCDSHQIIEHLDEIVYEPKDPVTKTYLFPGYIKGFYEKIKNQITSDTLLISLAQGAFRAGVSIANGLEIDHLPIRLSIYKSQDTWPHIRAEEFLEKASDRPLFVFDEDSASGRTLKIFSDYLKSLDLEADFGVISTLEHPSHFKANHFYIEINPLC